MISITTSVRLRMKSIFQGTFERLLRGRFGRAPLTGWISVDFGYVIEKPMKNTFAKIQFHLFFHP